MFSVRPTTNLIGPASRPTKVNTIGLLTAGIQNVKKWVYYNLPHSQLLQHIQNSLARAVVKTPKFSHTTLILKSLHWLKVNERIEYKILSLTYKTLSPSLNLLMSITWSLFSLLVALVRHLSSPSLVHPHLPLSKSQIALSIMHHPVFGIIFLSHSVNLIHHLSTSSLHPSLPLSSIPDLKLTCSTNSSHHRSSPTHWTSTGLPSRTTYHSVLF